MISKWKLGEPLDLVSRRHHIIQALVRIEWAANKPNLPHLQVSPIPLRNSAVVHQKWKPISYKTFVVNRVIQYRDGSVRVTIFKQNVFCQVGISKHQSTLPTQKMVSIFPVNRSDDASENYGHGPNIPLLLYENRVEKAKGNWKSDDFPASQPPNQHHDVVPEMAAKAHLYCR